MQSKALQPADYYACTIPTENSAGQFVTFADWVRNATREIGGENALCVDAQDRICAIGSDFMRARDEGTFPVRYYFGAGPQTQAQQRRAAQDADRQLHPWRPKSMRA